MADEEVYDLVVIGVGSGGEVVAGELARSGGRVAAVESALVGGECPYLACVPSKALLLAAREHRTRGGAHAAAWRAAVGRRDAAALHRDDSESAHGLREAGVALVRGRGVLAGRSGRHLVVEVSGAAGPRTLHAAAVVLGTGSEPVVPPIAGLDDVPTWTSDQALTSSVLPGRLAVLGGGAVGCELTQVYASFGADVVLLEAGDALVPSEPPWAGERLAAAMADLGVDVRLGATVTGTRRRGAGLRVQVERGRGMDADRLLVAGGRRPRSTDLGLGTLGVPSRDGAALATDARCRVVGPDGEPVDGLYAVGDVTGVAPYTHTATYQGRLVAAHLLGRGHDADYSAVPRVVYTDPAVFGVGLTAKAASDRGLHVLTEGIDLADTARGFLAGAGHGHLELVADAGSGVLLGATAVGPDADGWAGELALAVRAGLHVRLLADHVHAFPAWAEVVQPAAARLAERIGAGVARRGAPT